MRLSLRRSEDGFGLVELLIAMTVLAIGIMGVASAFISGMVALRRANQTATATALADSQLERYRALRYCAIFLDPATVPAAATNYWNGFSDPLVTSSSCPTQAPAEATDAQQELSGSATPDGSPYRVDTYIVEKQPVSVPVIDSRELKTVTVVVRDGRDPTKILVRQDSSFDWSLGKDD
jgi:prepilin-type N-terminal cleavage/methylation domain-containing protein